MTATHVRKKKYYIIMAYKLTRERGGISPFELRGLIPSFFCFPVLKSVMVKSKIRVLLIVLSSIVCSNYNALSE
jgi:hypothetical protein